MGVEPMRAGSGGPSARLGTDELERLGVVAAGVLAEAEDVFAAGLGSAEVVVKGTHDFATAVDLAIERRVGDMLTERTGLAVHGEEFGGPPLETGVVWVLDPVDGTANYARRLPLTAINLALLVDGVPELGLSWLPLLGERYLAVAGGPLRRNGVPLAPLRPSRLADDIVTISSVTSWRDGPYPGPWRLALADAIGRRSRRVRMLGSAAVDLAWTAAGLVGAAVEFGNNAWDNAPGACLVRAAGGRTVDLGGGEYRLASDSILAGNPGTVADLIEVVADLGDPRAYA